MNNIYETGEWSMVFIEFTVTALKKKPKATKCSDHRTMSLIAHATNRVASVPGRRIET
jgi:hypothetical protein